MTGPRPSSTYPGDVLLHDFVEPMGITPYRLAKDIDVTPSAIGEIVRRDRSVTAETALKLARYFGTSPDVWLGLQMGYDLKTAQDRIADALEAIRPRKRVAA
jgi:addiction module HigA family antidote